MRPVLGSLMVMRSGTLRKIRSVHVWTCLLGREPFRPSRNFLRLTTTDAGSDENSLLASSTYPSEQGLSDKGDRRRLSLRGTPIMWRILCLTFDWSLVVPPSTPEVVGVVDSSGCSVVSLTLCLGPVAEVSTRTTDPQVTLRSSTGLEENWSSCFWSHSPLVFFSLSSFPV